MVQPAAEEACTGLTAEALADADRVRKYRARLQEVRCASSLLPMVLFTLAPVIDACRGGLNSCFHGHSMT